MLIALMVNRIPPKHLLQSKLLYQNRQFDTFFNDYDMDIFSPSKEQTMLHKLPR